MAQDRPDLEQKLITDCKPNQVPTLCRACGHMQMSSPSILSCPNCSSRRQISHPELSELSIAHVDCDAFYCSVEKRDNPELKHKPIVVGGGRRGVVSAACYNARLYGVKSAMPMFKALKACPDLIVVRGDHTKYAREGRRIKNMMRDLTPLVQPLSIDEAFLDLTGTERLHGCTPAQSLARLQNRIWDEVGVTVSIGLSYNKFLAKTASDLDKPSGFAILGRAEALDFLAPKPVEFIYGIGPAFARKLNKVGIQTISDVRKRSDSQMAKQFGDLGLHLARLARAEDSRPVSIDSKRKSVSAEITFETDIAEIEPLKDRLWQVCVKASDHAKSLDIAGRIVTLKLKTRQFETLTRRRTLPQPAQLADILFHTLEPLLETEANGRKFRLIGAGFAGLIPHSFDATGDLLDPMASKRGQAERARDKARAKFGKKAVMTGRELRRQIDRSKSASKSKPKPKNAPFPSKQ